MTNADRPADPGRGPLTTDGLCVFHEDLLPMDCTLVARQGCVGCMLSRRNLDAPSAEGFIDVDAGGCRCPRCSAPLALQATRSGAWVAVGGDGQPHRHHVAYAIPVGLEAHEARRSAPEPIWKRKRL